MPKTSSSRPYYFPSSATGFLLVCWLALGPVHATENAMCRELDRRFDLIEPGIVSTQLNSALFSAADTGCKEFSQRLLAAGPSLDARDHLGATPLTHAARVGQQALVEFFLSNGAQVNARDIFGSTALHVAAENERPTTVTLQLTKGADPSVPGRLEIASLAIAAFKGNDRIVEQLLSRHVDANATDVTGKAAITYAASRGFADTVCLLLNAGVDANQRYGNDLTALMWAVGYEDGVGVRAVESVLDLLLDGGAEIDAVDDRGRTALMIAAELAHPEIVEMLIRRGASQNLRGKGGKAALDLTADDNVRRTLATAR
jgi:uncharacterized protein